MSTRMRDLLTGGLGELRHEPTGKRIRAVLDGGTVADTTRALLVWEPRRIVPSYAVPAGDRVVPDLGWTYQQPLHDATQVRGLIAFFNERLDVIVDGERLEQPITPWSAEPGT